MNDIFEQVYDSLQGLLVEEAALSWVPNICYPGSAYDQAYQEMYRACQRLSDRLGVAEDEDIESIRQAYETMQALLCRQMFAAGAAYANMKNSPNSSCR